MSPFFPPAPSYPDPISILSMGRSPCCDENGLKKGPWTAEEDQKLTDYIDKHGHGSWRALPKLAGMRNTPLFSVSAPGTNAMASFFVQNVAHVLLPCMSQDSTGVARAAG